MACPSYERRQIFWWEIGTFAPFYAASTMNLQQEIQKRRTFAIISHPDAGKTTLTEKFLLFGGAIQTAGAVKSNKIKKFATSDFMDIERQRGISVATSVMTFGYEGRLINLLDTPGHKDFAEDTFRTLTAVDSVVLVVDCVKGVEEQTEKLMEVCRMRKIPVIIYINKLDRDGKDPFDLLDELEVKLQMPVRPLSWPISMGKGFRGVYNLYRRNLLLFHPNQKASEEDLVPLADLNNTLLDDLFDPKDAARLRHDADLIEGVYDPFSIPEYRKGNLAPVFFGSAVNNFGVKELLDAFIEIAPGPQPRDTSTREVYPDEDRLSGFVFKIHANLDPRHRDRIAFLRICSGRLQRNHFYHHVRLKRELRFSNPYSFMAREKNVVEDSYPGDVVGLFDTGNFKIGDTLTEGEEFNFTGIPSFSPEIFKELINRDPMKTKQLAKGIRQLTDEGVAQLFTQYGGNRRIIGCVGDLQFEVIQYRLLQEYGASCQFLPLSLYKACWISGPEAELEEFIRFKPGNIVEDKDGRLVYLAQSAWYLDTEMANHPEISFQFSSEIHQSA